MMNSPKNINETEEVKQTLENSEQIEQENSQTIDEPHYMAHEEQIEQVLEQPELQIYSPQQLLNFKRKPHRTSFEEFNLDEDPKKKVCCPPESSTAEQSENNHIMGELEKLAEMLQRENQKKYSYPKNLPLPSNVDDHIDQLNLRFIPSTKQDEFISNYVKQDDLLRIKIGLCDDIIKEEETQKFEDWVEQLCNSTNHESLKEMARKQKVKRYLEKKHNRTYEKKVHYHIRQKVAEERLRVKGRFVTWSQALKMLNQQSDFRKSWSYNDYFKIKSLLNEKFGAVKSERSLRF